MVVCNLSFLPARVDQSKRTSGSARRRTCGLRHKRRTVTCKDPISRRHQINQTHASSCLGQEGIDVVVLCSVVVLQPRAKNQSLRRTYLVQRGSPEVVMEVDRYDNLLVVILMYNNASSLPARAPRGTIYHSKVSSNNNNNKVMAKSCSKKLILVTIDPINPV